VEVAVAAVGERHPLHLRLFLRRKMLKEGARGEGRKVIWKGIVKSCTGTVLCTMWRVSRVRVRRGMNRRTMAVSLPSTRRCVCERERERGGEGVCVWGGGGRVCVRNEQDRQRVYVCVCSCVCVFVFVFVRVCV